MTLLRELSDVEVPGSESERPRYRLLLVLDGRTRQIEVHVVLADLLLMAAEKSARRRGSLASKQSATR